MLIALLVACGSAPTPSSAPVAAPPAEKAPPAAPVADEPAAPAVPAFDPLAGQPMAEICVYNSLLLLKFDYAEVAGNYDKLCCGPGLIEGNEGSCELDWPFSDVPSCKAWDEMRNGLYARYGYVFKDAAWQAVFDDMPWYKKNPAFDPETMPEVAKRNVELLKRYKAEKHLCAD